MPEKMCALIISSFCPTPPAPEQPLGADAPANARQELQSKHRTCSEPGRVRERTEAFRKKSESNARVPLVSDGCTRAIRNIAKQSLERQAERAAAGDGLRKLPGGGHLPKGFTKREGPARR